MEDNNKNENKENKEKEKENDNQMDIININEEIQKKSNEIKIDNKENITPKKESENKENKILIENEPYIPPENIKKERMPFKLDGGKLPLSIFTRRVFDISLLKNYLNSDSSSGICGSVNLGNTCFMNSSIACLLFLFFLSYLYYLFLL